MWQSGPRGCPSVMGRSTPWRTSTSRSSRARSSATWGRTGRGRPPPSGCSWPRPAPPPGEANLWPALTGAETLHLFGRMHGDVDETYKRELVDRFELDVDKKVRAYSKGNRQKVLLIAALMCRPPLLILDEPTSGLDPLMEREFRRTVEEAKGRG